MTSTVILEIGGGFGERKDSTKEGERRRAGNGIRKKGTEEDREVGRGAWVGGGDILVYS